MIDQTTVHILKEYDLKLSAIQMSDSSAWVVVIITDQKGDRHMGRAGKGDDGISALRQAWIEALNSAAPGWNRGIEKI